MEKYFMIKTEGHVLVITIMQCPESNVVCLECDTEEEVYRLIRKMDCEITFAQPFHWRHSGQSVWRGRKADFFFVKNRRICNYLRIKRLFGLHGNWVTR